MENEVTAPLKVEDVKTHSNYRQLCASHIQNTLLQPKPQNFNAGKYMKRGMVPCRRGCGLFFTINRANANDHKNNNYSKIAVDSKHGIVYDDDNYSEYIIHSQHCNVKYDLMEFSRNLRKPENKYKMRDDIKGWKPASQVVLEKKQLVDKVNTLSISDPLPVLFDDEKEQTEKPPEGPEVEEEWKTIKYYSIASARAKETRKFLKELPIEDSDERVKKWLEKCIK